MTKNFTHLFLLLGVVILLASCGNKSKRDYASEEDSTIEIMEEYVDPSYSYAQEETMDFSEYDSGEDYTLTANPWTKDYFHNEWGEDDMDSPFIYTVLGSTPWNLKLDYIPPTSAQPTGLFRFSLLNDEGGYEDMFGPVNILIRAADGETKAIKVTGVKNSVAFVEDPATVTSLKRHLDQDDFDILMQFEKYNERHRVQTRWESTPGLFMKVTNAI